MAEVKSEALETGGASIPDTSTPSLAQIDSRRAQQLLERALNLSERGDVPAAVLACRQAITLAPAAPQAYSMLGLLLERAGDKEGAITAYEKVLQLDPGSLLERESLTRLRAALARQRSASDLFNFDESELFDDRADRGHSQDGAARNGDAPHEFNKVAAAQAAIDAAAIRAMREQNPAATPQALVTPAAVSTPALRTNISAPPILTPTRANSAVTSGQSGTIAPIFDMPLPSPQSVWQRLKARPSYYFRGIPLTATTVASLLFLLWAHNYAVSREVAPVSATTATSTTIVQRNAADSPTSDITTSPNAAAATDVTAAVSNTATSESASTPIVTASPAAPSTPVTSQPTLVPQAPATSNNTNSRAAAPDLPRPQINDSGGTPAVAPSVAPVPDNDSGGVSSGGAPLGPGGNPNRNFTRIAPGGGNVAPPPRPEAQAARDERAATSGNAGAIAAATRAISAGGGDTAFRYQQRAQLYLDSGDNIRAINDFQTAISAFNDMIARGDRASAARAGIQACQRGIQVARTRAGR